MVVILLFILHPYPNLYPFASKPVHKGEPLYWRDVLVKVSGVVTRAREGDRAGNALCRE